MEDNKFDRKQIFSIENLDFARLVVNDLSKTKEGRSILKKYKQSEVRDIVENYSTPKNQEKLIDISNLLYAQSKQYQRLINHYAYMSVFSYVINPIKDIRKENKNKVTKQYVEIGELVRQMNLRHEMSKVMKIAFKEDVFYGYVHRDKKSFYIQAINHKMCKISSNEDGIYNYSIDMSKFQSDESTLQYYANEIKVKYFSWKALKAKNPTISEWVELDAKNTICIKVNEEMLETFPPFAGTFDSIYDIAGYKKLRKDKAELGNYMILTQELPIRKDSEHNNDFMIDLDMMRYFHNQTANSVPDNIGVVTSPMKIGQFKFDKDRADSDGVALAERDFWSASGTSQLLFNADNTTSEALKASIKTDEEIVFGVVTQIERWINRYLKYEYNNLLFNVSILDITHFNQQDKYKMYLETAQYGIPVKGHVGASIGLEPIEIMNLAYLENDLLKMHEEFIPLMSSHTMGSDGIEGLKGDGSEGRPKTDNPSDETVRHRDKPNS